MSRRYNRILANSKELYNKFHYLKKSRKSKEYIEAHALAFKIFNSNGEIEYNDEECNMIKEYASLCSPAFIDAINKLLLE